MTGEEKQLDLLAIFHYIVGGITALFACVPLIHVAIGIAIIFGMFDEPNPPPALIGWVFVLIGGTFVLSGWALAIAILIAGRKLKKRMARTYCLVIGAVECLIMPFGTVLGIFTIILLMKDSMKEIFSANQRVEGN